MGFAVIFLALALLPSGPARKESPAAGPKPVTVPFSLDHNRIVVDVTLALPDGSLRRIPAWVDNGNPDLYLSRRLASQLNLNVTCDDKICSSPPPSEIAIGGMKISLAELKQAKIPLKPVVADAVMAPGMTVQINIPSPVLRHYDVLIDYLERKLTMGPPGSLKFNGVNSKVGVNRENGLLQVTSEIENKKYNLALDLGSPISFLSQELFDKLAAAHPEWPRMTGAVGPANMWGLPDEPQWQLMRVDRLQYGPLHLSGVPFVAFPQEVLARFEKRAGVATAGLLGAEALLNYRVGLDYARSMVYFDIGRLSNLPDFDVVGLVLRPDDDGSFTILGVADCDGKPSVGEVQAGDRLVAVDGTGLANSTMGSVWSLLLGGKEHTLTVERSGRQFTVVAPVKHFLAEESENNSRGKSNKD
ncbi:MAG TPA: hypothetical protein VMU61_03480 [Candidatus Aquilonibacter sp.]|nr:hypothetical protein [Candidatus Aquilonibacter sp.]